ncbi:neuroblast differentiation-associated protein AHNAK [Hippocampus comes]|uniref:neuroblast differentiation-associated protein AHNAK n=1 Tax=Hippocampus comes TaxID=109280 RepID=UPI00094F30BC|nr:PREDICTED: neuroblast differentiation-associated protein AHNAK-like [Hippocampus comes]
MSADSMSFSSQRLVLENAGKGSVVRGIPDGTFVASSGVQADDIVAATIHLDHLSQNEVQNILKALQPYDNNMKVVTKKELSTTASLSSLALDLQDPSEMISGDFNKESEFSGSMGNDLPYVNLTNPSADAGAEFEYASHAQVGPGPDGILATPNVSTPHLNNHSVLLDIDKPQVKTSDLRYRAPHFTMPKFDAPAVKTPEVGGDLNLPSVNGETKGLSLSSPKLDMNGKNVDLNGPKVDLNGPGVNIGSSNADISVSSDPFKWPHQKWKLKKPKLPTAKTDLDLDAGLSTPEVDLSAPKVEGGLHAPYIDANLPNADLHGPDLDIQQPEFDGLSGKFVWPHQKWKKPKIKGPKADLDVDTGLHTPGLDLSKADLKGPSLDVEAPNLGIDTPSGKKTWHLKLKKPKAPDLKLDTDVSTPDIGLSVPGIDGDINAPNVDMNLPKSDLNVNAPDTGIETPSGKVKFRTLKKPKFRFAGPKVKTPSVDLDTDVKGPDLRLSTSQASLHGPDLNLPKADVDVEVPDVDASGKIKWPTLKKPKWSISSPKVNGPDLDAHVSTPDLSLSAPKIDGELNAPDLKLKTAELNGPKLDIDATAPSGKFKWLKKPKIGTLKGLKSDIDGDIKVPDVDLRSHDIDLKTPNIEGPDLNFSTPNANIRGPNLDLQTPTPNIESTDAKLKLPKLKMPKWPKVKGPQLDTDLKAPNIDANADVPNLDVNASSVNLNAPDLSLSTPKLGSSLDTPDIDLQSPVLSNGHLRFPKLKLPTLSGLKAEKPNVDLNADVKGPHLDMAPLNINAPDLNLSTPNIDGVIAGPDVSLPKANLSGVHFELPDNDAGLPRLNLSGPQITRSGADMNLEAPDVRLNSHVPGVDIGMPTPEFKGPEAQLKSPVIGLDSQVEDFTLPHYKLPNLDLSSPGVELPSVHPSVQTGLDAPKVNIGTPKTDADISVPTVDLIGPNLKGNIKGPEVDVESPGLEKPKLPHFKVPKLSFSGSKTKTVSPRLSLDGEISPLTVSSPEISTNSPEIAMRAGDAELKGSPKSKFKWPFKWGFKSNSVDTEEYEINAEEDAPKFRIHTLPRPCIDTKTGTPDIFNLSKFDSEAKDYVVSKGIRLPVVNAPSRNGERVDIMERLRMAMEKAPSSNASPTEEKNVSLNMANANFHASGEAGDSSFFRGGTFKVEKPEFPLGSIDHASFADETDESNKLSLGLSNMLGLNV